MIHHLSSQLVGHVLKIRILLKVLKEKGQATFCWLLGLGTFSEET